MAKMSAFHSNDADAVVSVRVHVMAKAWPHCISCRIPLTTSWSWCLSTMTCISMSGLQHTNKMCFLAAVNAFMPHHTLTRTFNTELASTSATQAAFGAMPVPLFKCLHVNTQHAKSKACLFCCHNRSHAGGSSLHVLHFSTQGHALDHNTVYVWPAHTATIILSCT